MMITNIKLSENPNALMNVYVLFRDRNVKYDLMVLISKLIIL